MPEVEDAAIESSEFSSHASADSPQSDIKIQTFSGDLDKVITDELVIRTDRCFIQTKKIIRYTKEQLLALRESPLVKKPDSLAPSSLWHGEIIVKKESKKNNTDGTQENEKSHNLGEGLSKPNTLGIPDSPLLAISKSPNGSEPTSPRPSDKIVLGPPKMNFASSSVGGLKNTEDKTKNSRSEGLRQRQDDVSFPRTGIKDYEPRAPRGPTGGRGFIGREALRDRTLTEKTLKDSTASLHNNHGRGLGHSRSQETTRNNRRDGGVGGKDYLSRTNYSRHQHSDDRSEIPEWVTYNPQTDEDSKQGENGEFEDKKPFDFQAWRSSMKEQEKEKKDKERMRSDKERKESAEKVRARSVSRADSSTSWRPENKVVATEDTYKNSSKEKSSSEFDEASRNLSNVDQLFGPGAIDLNSSAFDKFLSQHNLAMAEDNVPKVSSKIAEITPREQGTSRFARFFNNNNDDDMIPQESDHNGRHSGIPVPTQNQIQNTSNELKPVPISLDTLFQSQATAPLSPRITSNDGARLLSRMPTEDDILLQTYGAKPAHKTEDKERNYEDEVAMKKIYAALKKGPSAEVLRQTLPNVPSSLNQPQTQQHSTIVQPGLPFNDPSIVSTQKSNPMVKSGHHPPKVDMSNKHLGFSELPPSDSVKKINMLFGGNVPTSVYRQLSSRSDNGSRESSAASSPALKFNAKPNISNFPHSPQSSAHVHDINAPIFKSPSPRSSVLPHQQSHNHSPYHNVAPPYSNGPNNSQHSSNRQEYPQPVGRNIPVEQLFGMVPPRNVSQQIHPQFQQPPIPVSMPPLPYGIQHQPERYPQQLQFTGAPIPHLSVHHHPGMLPPGTEALFANMHGYAQFIPNLVNNAMAPNNISGIPNNSNLQQRGMMTLEEIERRSLGGR